MPHVNDQAENRHSYRETKHVEETEYYMALRNDMTNT